MGDKNIIEVFKKRKYNEYLIEERAKIEELKSNDKFEKMKIEYNKKVNKLLEEEGRKTEIGNFDIIYCPTSAELKKQIEEVEKEFEDKMDDRDRLIEEVLAQVMITETYEQEIEIYKKYGILDEQGKIYDYK